MTGCRLKRTLSISPLASSVRLSVLRVGIEVRHREPHRVLHLAVEGENSGFYERTTMPDYMCLLYASGE